jgi:hypothetical protein
MPPYHPRPLPRVRPRRPPREPDDPGDVDRATETTPEPEVIFANHGDDLYMKLADTRIPWLVAMWESMPMLAFEGEKVICSGAASPRTL